MYTDDDLDEAITAGVLTREAADAFRAHIAGRDAPGTGTRADDENFRLVTGFNDIFVTIACLLVIFAAAFLFGRVAAPLGGLAVSAAAWAVAEQFTRRQRMALPSIVLLLAFAGGAAFAAWSGIAGLLPITSGQIVGDTWHPVPPETVALHTAAATAAAGVAGALAALAHWRRFHVPITIAAGVASLVALGLGLITAALHDPERIALVLPPLMIASGVAVFAFAMRWDMSDPERKTHRADIAFWLHLVAAPLIAHPLFHAMGVFDNGNLAPGTALGVIALYLAFGLVALAVDRRALLVSALVYVMAALYALIHGANADAGGVAFAALIVGGGLLTLSALWATARRALLRTVPPAWTHRLPPAR